MTRLIFSSTEGEWSGGTVTWYLSPAGLDLTQLISRRPEEWGERRSWNTWREREVYDVHLFDCFLPNFCLSDISPWPPAWLLRACHYTHNTRTVSSEGQHQNHHPSHSPEYVILGSALTLLDISLHVIQSLSISLTSLHSVLFSTFSTF